MEQKLQDNNNKISKLKKSKNLLIRTFKKQEKSDKAHNQKENETRDLLNKFKNNIESKMSDLDKMVRNKENEWNTKSNKFNNDVKKIDSYIKNNNVKKELDIVEKERD